MVTNIIHNLILRGVWKSAIGLQCRLSLVDSYILGDAIEKVSRVTVYHSLCVFQRYEI